MIPLYEPFDISFDDALPRKDDELGIGAGGLVSAESTKPLGLNTQQVIEAITTKGAGDTWKALAERLGCTRQNIDHYRKQYADEIQALAKAYLSADVPLFYRALSEKAQTGDVPAIRLVFEHLGLDKPEGDKGVTQDVIFEVVARYYANNEAVRVMVEQLQAEREKELAERRKALADASELG